jgi:hypothetical protein
MQSSTTVHGVSLRKNPRKGQLKVFDAFSNSDYLCIKLPTGYGKTFTATTCYAIKQKQGVNRLLFIFPTDAQLEQFVKDGSNDLYDSGVSGVRAIIDIRFYGVQALKKHRTNSAQVYAITVQALCANDFVVREMMQSGNWMVVVDEYHHYGIDKAWGKTVLSLSYKCLLAMSATPKRIDNDSAFGTPTVSVLYRDAVNEKAVKPLKGHAYVYVIDAINEEGDLISYTTNQLIKEAGGDSPEKIEKLKIARQMRWSPKYVSPLVTTPIDRMLSERVSTGYKLQAIVGALCVSHAELVCSQIASLYPELTVDWVGTGENGRSSEDNKKILAKFCPPKDERGIRSPTLDILVHVGIAGEGLDCVNVSEVIHLNRASKNNSNDQENGRAARYLEGVIGHINFDSDTDYAKDGYIGNAIMDAMDDEAPSKDEDDPVTPVSRDVPLLPDEPKIQIWDVRLEKIDSGDPGVQLMAKAIQAAGVSGIDYSDLNDLQSPEWDKVINLFRTMRTREAEELDEKSVILQWKEQINNALSVVTSLVIKNMVSDSRFDKGLIGDIKKRINGRKKMSCGAISEDLAICKQHYNWLKKLEQTVINEGVPQWLK